MNEFRRIIKSPYIYIFLLSYSSIWLLWNGIKLPFTDPDGIISYLPSIGYNPNNNLLRFLLAILVPAGACLLFWLLDNGFLKDRLQNKYLRRGMGMTLILMCMLLALCLGIFQNSTNPANNDPATYGGPYSHALLDTFHEGETLGPATSYEQKNLKPYRDFVIVHGVLQDPLRTVIAFKLFGRSIGASRAFATILVMLTMMLYYGLLLVLFRGNLIKSALGMAALGLLLLPSGTIPLENKLFIGIQFPFRDIATILFLMAAVLGFRYSKAERIKPLVICSALIGFVMVVGYGNSIDRAFYITALSAIWLVIVWLMTKNKTFWKITLPAFVVGCLVGLPLLGMALKWAFKDFLIYMFTMSKYKEYLDGNIFTQPNLSYSIMLLTVGASITIGGMFVLRAVAQPVIKASKREKLQVVKQALHVWLLKNHTPVLLFATALFFLRSAIGRADYAHFIYSVQWLYLFLIYVGLEYMFVALRKYQRALTFCGVIIITAVLGNFLVLVKDINLRNDAFPIHVSDKQLVRPDYLQTAAFLDKNLHGKDTFATLTSEGSWYYLANKPSPIRYYIIWYAYTGEQRREIAHDIDTNTHIKYIVTNNNWTSDFDYVPNPVRFPEVYQVLNKDYVPYTGFGQQTVWIRK